MPHRKKRIPVFPLISWRDFCHAQILEDRGISLEAIISIGLSHAWESEFHRPRLHAPDEPVEDYLDRFPKQGELF